MNTKDLKRISSQNSKLDKLRLKLSKLKEQKDELATDEYKLLESQVKDQMTELQSALKKDKESITAELSSVKKGITALKRKITSCQSAIAKTEAKLKEDGADKNELTTRKREQKNELATLEKELAQHEKAESLLLEAKTLFNTGATAGQKVAYPQSKAKHEFAIPPLYIGVAVGSLCIIAIAVFALVTSNSPAPQQKSLAQTKTEDAAVKDDSPAKEVSETLNGKAIITGNNVNMRLEPNIKSDAIKQLHKDMSVTVLEKKVVNESKDALLAESTQLTMTSGKKITLDAGKGVLIIEEKEDSFIVSYAIEAGKKVTGSVAKSAVTRISGDVWYKLKTENGTIGWMYGKYVKFM